MMKDVPETKQSSGSGRSTRGLRTTSVVTTAILLFMSAMYIMFADTIMHQSVRSLSGHSERRRFSLLRAAAGICRKKGMLAFSEALLVLMIPTLPATSVVDASAKMAMRFMLSSIVSFTTWIFHGEYWHQGPLMAEVFVFAPLSLCWASFVKGAQAKDAKATASPTSARCPTGLLYTLTASSVLSVGSGILMVSFPELMADGLIDSASLIPEHASVTGRALEMQNLTICRDLTRQVGVSLLVGEGLLLWGYKDALATRTQHVQVALACFARAVLAGCIAFYNQRNGGWQLAAWSDLVLCAVFACLYLLQVALLVASSVGLASRSKVHSS